MKYQPSPRCKRDDVVYTPQPMADAIVSHFKPNGVCLDAARGKSRAFYNAMPGCDWCEIGEGRDFFLYRRRVDWIVTNPPWSQIRQFLEHGYEIADNIVFLVTANHLFTKRRIRDMRSAGFGIAEILLVDTPPNFPQSGFQLAAVHVKRGHSGDIKFSTQI